MAANEEEKAKKGKGKIIANKNKKGEVISYRIRVCVGRDDQYKQVWRTCTIPRPEGLTPAKERKEVERQADAWEQAQKDEYEKNHVKTDKARITFADFTREHWMKDHVMPGHTPSSVKFFEYTSDRAITYFGEKKKLREIDTEAVKKYLNYLKTPLTDEGEAFSATSQKHFFGTLRNILRYAKRMGYIDQDPTENLAPGEKPHREKKQIDFLTPQDAARFLDCLEKEPLFWRTMLNIMLISGLRRGEACGLQWQDLDSEKMELHVERNVTLDKNSETGFNVGKPKNSESRIVPISSRICTLLQNLKKQREYDLSEKDENGIVTVQVLLMPDSYIFSNVEDPYKPIRPDSITTKVKRFVEKNDLPPVSPHDLRHSCAALALEAGTDLKAVQELLGHADPETTMRYYAGVTEARKRKSVEGTENILAKIRAN